MTACEMAQPRARAQVAASTVSCDRNRSRASPVSSFHATITSHAGSPITRQPQSITPRKRPAHGDHVSRVEIAVKPARRTTPCRRTDGFVPNRRHGFDIYGGAERADRARVGSSRIASGTPRHELSGPGADLGQSRRSEVPRQIPPSPRRSESDWRGVPTWLVRPRSIHRSSTATDSPRQVHRERSAPAASAVAAGRASAASSDRSPAARRPSAS